MRIKFFDTETTGLPLYKEPSEDPRQPHLVQLAALLVDPAGLEVGAMNAIIKPNGWVISKEVSDIHGITHERAMDEGIPEDEALDQYLALYRECDLRVAHNTTFDNRLIRIALKRYRPDLISDKEWKDSKRYYCTMLGYTKLFGGKWPKLPEAHRHLLGHDFEGAHDAMNDLRACRAVYYALQAYQVVA